MNSDPAPPFPSVEQLELTPEELADILATRAARAARAMTTRAAQKLSAAARWEKLTQEEKSKQMRTVRLKNIRRKYVLTVLQDHNPDQVYPFTVSVRTGGGRQIGFSDIQGTNLARLLNKATDAIFAHEEQPVDP